MTPATAARLMRIGSAGFLFAGVVFATAAFAAVDRPGVLFLDLLKWPLDGDPGALGQDARWLSAVGGGLLVALAVLTALVVAPAIERGDREARRGAVIAILMWFVIDSAGSIAAGVVSNALFNALFGAVYLLPLVAADLSGAGARKPA